MIFRRVTAFLLLLAFLTQAFSRYIVVADYYVNTAAYAANCINKDRPWMHCNGRCQLCKKLHRQESQEDKQSPERKAGGDRSDNICASFIEFTALQWASPIKTSFPEIRAGNPVSMPRDFFHPPGAHLA